MQKWIDLYLKIYNLWMRLPEKLRYLLVGGYNTVVSYVLYALFVMAGMAPQGALLLAFLVSSVNGYWTQKIYVFGTKGNYLAEYGRCLGAWGISYAMNAVLLEGVLWLGWNALLAQGVALGIVTVNSYLMLKYLAFRVGQKKENYYENSGVDPVL